MWLVISAANDMAALWAYEGLKARGLTPIELVSAEMLAYSLNWKHQLSTDNVSIEISLADGRTIKSEATLGVLNRLPMIPTGHLLLAKPADRDYASQELTAFFLSWLNAFSRPVINRPTPQGLSGPWRHVSEWVWLAAKAGLPTPDYEQTCRDALNQRGGEQGFLPNGTRVNTVFVIGKKVVGPPVPVGVIEGCQRLARMAGIEMLGIDFITDPVKQWTFVRANPLPNLRLGGGVLLDALKSVLQRDGERK